MSITIQYNTIQYSTVQLTTNIATVIDGGQTGRLKILIIIVYRCTRTHNIYNHLLVI